MTRSNALAIGFVLSLVVPATAAAQEVPGLAPITIQGPTPDDATSSIFSPSDRPAHQRVIVLGTRMSGRAGDYLEGGLGGHLRLQVHRWVTVELFTDQFAGTMNGSFRHDHEIGGTLQINVIRGRRGEIYPFVGACASLAVLNAPQGGASATDVRAGARAGVGGMLDLGHGLGLEAQLTAITYVGHPLEAYSWTAMTGPNITTETVGQLTVAVDYAF